MTTNTDITPENVARVVAGYFSVLAANESAAAVAELGDDHPEIGYEMADIAADVLNNGDQLGGAWLDVCFGIAKQVVDLCAEIVTETNVAKKV